VRADPRFASALSASAETDRAVELACDQCGAALGAPCDAAFVFFTRHHADNAAQISEILRRRLAPGALVGVSAEAVIGDTTELEGSPGLSVLAASLPGSNVTPFWAEDLIDAETSTPDDPQLAGLIGADARTRATFLFADPFSVPLVRLLPTLNAARPRDNPAPIFGGLASAGRQAGENVILLNDRIERSGAAGLSVGGPLRVDALVSQGCSPFGPTFVITKARRNIILELGGRPALEAVSETINELSDAQREGLKSGLFIGRVINEYKSHFGRGDFLIRNILGVDQTRGALAVADTLHVGQTIRLHMRDAKTAREDLALLLDAQKLYEPPSGVLLVTCNGRGRKFFGTPNHDASSIGRAFLKRQGGEITAKPGFIIEPSMEPAIPLAGFFAAGEIGPIAGESFLHAHTACAAIFRNAHP